MVVVYASIHIEAAASKTTSTGGIRVAALSAGYCNIGSVSCFINEGVYDGASWTKSIVWSSNNSTFLVVVV